MIQDPHGWILTLTSVCVVFSVLALLWLVFGLLGSGLRRKSVKADAPEVAAAITTALHLYLADTDQDRERLRLTIKPRESAWATPGRNFRKIRKP